MQLKNNRVPLVLQHIPELGYSLPTIREADVSLSPQGGEMATGLHGSQVEIVNYDHHAELSDWVRLVQHSKNQRMKRRLNINSGLILPHLYLHLLTIRNIPPLEESGRFFFLGDSDYLTGMKNLMRSPRILTKADSDQKACKQVSGTSL